MAGSRRMVHAARVIHALAGQPEMLVHRLPLNASPLGRVGPGSAHASFAALKRFAPQRWAWALRGGDLVFVTYACSMILAQGGHVGIVQRLAAVSACAALWVVIASGCGLYRPATLQAGIAHPLLALSCMAVVLAAALAIRLLAIGLAAAPADAALGVLLPILRSVLLVALAMRLAWLMVVRVMLLRGGVFLSDSCSGGLNRRSAVFRRENRTAHGRPSARHVLWHVAGGC